MNKDIILSNVTVHGFNDYNPTLADVMNIINNRPAGASADCMMSMEIQKDSILRLTLDEWHRILSLYNNIVVSLKCSIYGEDTDEYVLSYFE